MMKKVKSFGARVSRVLREHLNSRCIQDKRYKIDRKQVTSAREKKLK